MTREEKFFIRKLEQKIRSGNYDLEKLLASIPDDYQELLYLYLLRYTLLESTYEQTDYIVEEYKIEIHRKNRH